jgi:hypothetical protein
VGIVNLESKGLKHFRQWGKAIPDGGLLHRCGADSMQHFSRASGTETMLFARELLLQYYWRDLIPLDHSLLAITLFVLLDGRSLQLL